MAYEQFRVRLVGVQRAPQFATPQLRRPVEGVWLALQQARRSPASCASSSFFLPSLATSVALIFNAELLAQPLVRRDL